MDRGSGGCGRVSALGATGLSRWISFTFRASKRITSCRSVQANGRVEHRYGDRSRTLLRVADPEWHEMSEDFADQTPNVKDQSAAPEIVPGFTVEKPSGRYTVCLL